MEIYCPFTADIEYGIFNRFFCVFVEIYGSLNLNLLQLEACVVQSLPCFSPHKKATANMSMYEIWHWKVKFSSQNCKLTIIKVERKYFRVA